MKQSHYMEDVPYYRGTGNKLNQHGLLLGTLSKTSCQYRDSILPDLDHSDKVHGREELHRRTINLPGFATRTLFNEHFLEEQFAISRFADQMEGRSCEPTPCIKLKGAFHDKTNIPAFTCEICFARTSIT